MHFSTSSGVSEHSKQWRASKWVSGARKRVNGRLSDPICTSGFLIVQDHSAAAKVRFWLPRITSLSSARQSRIEEKSKRKAMGEKNVLREKDFGGGRMVKLSSVKSRHSAPAEWAFSFWFCVWFSELFIYWQIKKAWLQGKNLKCAIAEFYSTVKPPIMYAKFGTKKNQRFAISKWISNALLKHLGLSNGGYSAPF